MQLISEPKTPQYGKQQAPVLFLLYVNDLSSVITLPISQFAGDTSLIVKVENAQEIECLASYKDISAWCEKNWLILNIKTLPKPSKVKVHISHEYQSLTSKNKTTFLGVVLNDRRLWKDHMEHLVMKLVPFTYALRTISSTVSLAS